MVKVTLLVTLAIVAVTAQVTWAAKRYYVSEEARPFVGAWIGCKTGGMELASVQSEDEQNAIGNATIDAEYQSANGYWIGAVAERDSIDSFHWISTGLRLVYDNWGSGQPRYMSNGYPEAGYCVRIGDFYKINSPYEWENIDCNSELYYVCELSTD